MLLYNISKKFPIFVRNIPKFHITKRLGMRYCVSNKDNEKNKICDCKELQIKNEIKELTNKVYGNMKTIELEKMNIRYKFFAFIFFSLLMFIIIDSIL